MKKINWKQLLLCIAIPLAVGGISALLTRNSMESFQNINQPPLSPPAWLFPVVWTILYTLMGIASYLVLSSGKNPIAIRASLWVYALQLLVNFLWPIFFFNLEAYLFSFFWLLLLWALVAFTILLFSQLSKASAWLLVPYLLWLTFAGYLNFAIYLLN